MSLYNVYPRFDVELERAEGSYVYAKDGTKYLDLYGGHGVISVGHSHPDFNAALKAQIDKMIFYSNSVKMPIQEELAAKLTKLSGYNDHSVFLCNSGAEAVENALKLASFHTGKSKFIAFEKSFHGRTEAALAVTDNPKLQAPLNTHHFPVEFIEMNDEIALSNALSMGDVAGVILEGIQGVGGLNRPSDPFLRYLRAACTSTGTVLILDEIQSGVGRSGNFFAHQSAKIQADVVTMAKGLGNGYPIGGVLISPRIKPWPGMLGTTFGGNPLACAAALAVLNIVESENLIKRAKKMERVFKAAFAKVPNVKVVGKGLMLGVDLGFPIADLRKQLLTDYHMFTGNASNPHVLRILPPLTVSEEAIQYFAEAVKSLLP